MVWLVIVKRGFTCMNAIECNQRYRTSTTLYHNAFWPTCCKWQAQAANVRSIASFACFSSGWVERLFTQGIVVRHFALVPLHITSKHSFSDFFIVVREKTLSFLTCCLGHFCLVRTDPLTYPFYFILLDKNRCLP